MSDYRLTFCTHPHDQAYWMIVAQVKKYRVGEEEPYQIQVFPGNLLLNEGINVMWDLVLGSAGSAWNNANARFGVGNGSAVAVATQTGLQGTSTAFAGMGAGYPSRTGQVVSFQGTFGTGSANFAWEEWTIDNGTGASGTINMNRRATSMGTKTSTEIWVLSADITLS